MNSALVGPRLMGTRKNSWLAFSEKNILGLAIAISFLLHSSILVVLFFTHPEKRKDLRKVMAIVYQVQKKQGALKQSVPEVRTIKEKVELPSPKVLSAKMTTRAPVMESAAKSPAHLGERQKTPGTVPVVSAKRYVSVPVLHSEKMASPRYLNYNDRIRAKIKNRVYSYVDDPAFREGEVYLTFVLLSNGVLKDIRVIDNKTHANDFLRNIGLKSIRESSPFPPFPDDLKYPELSFNVVISFQVDK